MMMGSNRGGQANNKKILILGGSSFIGKLLFRTLGPDRALATYYQHPVEHGLRFDALSMHLADVIEVPQAISHAVILLGDTDPDSCAADPTTSYRLNVERVKTVIEWTRTLGVIPVFASSEFVFDGMKGNYVEEDKTRPILTYGRQKLEIEHYLQRTCQRYVIVRLAKVFGSARGDGSLFTSWLDVVERGQPSIRCAADQIFSPIYVDDVVAAIMRLIALDAQGVFHLAGPQPFSRIELLKLLLERMRASMPVHTTVVPCSIHDFHLQEKRPLNVSMKPEKLVRTTGITLTDVEEICESIVSASLQRV